MTYRLVPQTVALRTLVVDRYGDGSRIGHQATELAHLINATLTRLTLATPDGYATTCPGAPGRDGGKSSTSPDRLGDIVVRRDRFAEVGW